MTKRINENVKPWNYYEVKARKYGTAIGIVQCPDCLCTLHWRNYNEFLKGIKYCPFCGHRLEGLLDIAEQEAGAKTRPWKDLDDILL